MNAVERAARGAGRLGVPRVPGPLTSAAYDALGGEPMSRRTVGIVLAAIGVVGIAGSVVWRPRRRAEARQVPDRRGRVAGVRGHGQDLPRPEDLPAARPAARGPAPRRPPHQGPRRREHRQQGGAQREDRPDRGGPVHRRARRAVRHGPHDDQQRARRPGVGVHAGQRRRPQPGLPAGLPLRHQGRADADLQERDRHHLHGPAGRRGRGGRPPRHQLHRRAGHPGAGQPRVPRRHLDSSTRCRAS